VDSLKSRLASHGLAIPERPELSDRNTGRLRGRSDIIDYVCDLERCLAALAAKVEERDADRNTLADAAVIQLLGDEPENSRIEIEDIARILKVSEDSVRVVVQRMEARGLIKYVPPATPPADAKEPCPECSGTGMRSPITNCPVCRGAGSARA
jgi:Mn-dependent transcriptional regulator